MKNILLSFIIPVYNGEKYLSKCLESLLSQNISSDLYEIICVDDNSKDNSVECIKKYQEQYSNIHLVEHSINLKTGTSCNDGLKNAYGKYIWIIGQDDWIEKNVLKDMLLSCEENELDILLFNYNRVDEKENKLHSATVFSYTKTVLNGIQFINQYFPDSYVYYLLGYEWRGIFRKDFLIQNNVKFREGAIYEDTIFLFKSIFYAERMQSLEDFIYNYRINTMSITDNTKKYRGDLLFEFAFVAGDEVLELSKELKIKDTEISDTLHKKAIWYFESFSYKVVAANIREKKVFFSLIKSNRKTISEQIRLTSWYIRLLANPFLGYSISVILKPIYILKKKILKKPQKQDWCY